MTIDHSDFLYRAHAVCAWPQRDTAPPSSGLARVLLQIDITLSAATTFSANTFGVMNCAFLLCRSPSVTPRATEQRAQM